MKIFFDMEFTGLHKNTSIISIGLIADNGKKFYAELTDYDKTQIDPWLQENVLDNLWCKETDNLPEDSYPEYFFSHDSATIRKHLLRWLEQFTTVEWVSDVCHYDFVLLIDLLFDSALNIGDYPAVCHDINYDIAEYHTISIEEAFDISREDILESNLIEIKGRKHNALYDAKVIRAIYKTINDQL